VAHGDFAPKANAMAMARQMAQPRYPAASITIGRDDAFDVLSAAVAALVAAGCPPLDACAFADAAMGQGSYDEFLVEVSRWVSLHCGA
jgi:hypothetical protein